MVDKRFIQLIIRNLRLRKKDLIITTILLSFSLLVFLLGYTFSLGLNHFVDTSLHHIPNIRTLTFQSDSDISNNVQKYIDEATAEGLIIDNGEMVYGIMGKHDIQSLEPTLDELKSQLICDFYSSAYDDYIVVGRGLKKNDLDKIVLPLYLDVQDNQGYNLELLRDRSELDSGLNYLGVTFNMYFEDAKTHSKIERTFEVVGVYDNSKTQNDVQTALISYDALATLSQKIYEQDSDSIKSQYVITSSYSKNETVKKEIRAHNDEWISIIERSGFDSLYDFILIANLLSSVLSGILITITLAYISIITIRNVDRRRSEIGVLYTVGYSFKQIKSFFLLENIFISLVGYFVTFIIYVVSVIMINRLIFEKGVIEIINIVFRVDLLMFFLVLLFGQLLIIFTSIWRLKRVHTLEIKEMLYE